MAEDSHFTRMEEDVFPGQEYEDKVSNTSLDNYMWDLGPEGEGLTYLTSGVQYSENKWPDQLSPVGDSDLCDTSPIDLHPLHMATFRTGNQIQDDDDVISTHELANPVPVNSNFFSNSLERFSNIVSRASDTLTSRTGLVRDRTPTRCMQCSVCKSKDSWACPAAKRKPPCCACNHKKACTARLPCKNWKKSQIEAYHLKCTNREKIWADKDSQALRREPHLVAPLPIPRQSRQTVTPPEAEGVLLGAQGNTDGAPLPGAQTDCGPLAPGAKGATGTVPRKAVETTVKLGTSKPDKVELNNLENSSRQTWDLLKQQVVEGNKFFSSFEEVYDVTHCKIDLGRILHFLDNAAKMSSFDSHHMIQTGRHIAKMDNILKLAGEIDKVNQQFHLSKELDNEMFRAFRVSRLKIRSNQSSVAEDELSILKEQLRCLKIQNRKDNQSRILAEERANLAEKQLSIGSGRSSRIDGSLAGQAHNNTYLATSGRPSDPPPAQPGHAVLGDQRGDREPGWHPGEEARAGHPPPPVRPPSAEYGGQRSSQGRPVITGVTQGQGFDSPTPHGHPTDNTSSQGTQGQANLNQMAALTSAITAAMSNRAPTLNKASSVLWPRLSSRQARGEIRGSDFKMWKVNFWQSVRTAGVSHDSALLHMKLSTEVLPKKFRDLISNETTLNCAIEKIENNVPSERAERLELLNQIMNHAHLSFDASHTDRLHVLRKLEESILRYTSCFDPKKPEYDFQVDQAIKTLLILDNKGSQSMTWVDMAESWKSERDNFCKPIITSLLEHISKLKSLHVEVAAISESEGQVLKYHQTFTKATEAKGTSGNTGGDGGVRKKSYDVTLETVSSQFKKTS